MLSHHWSLSLYPLGWLSGLLNGSIDQLYDLTSGRVIHSPRFAALIFSPKKLLNLDLYSAYLGSF
jgi:hypothetical protein